MSSTVCSAGTVALSDRLTRPGPPACLETPQQVFGCPVCQGFPTCLRAGLPVLVGGEDAHRLNATAPDQQVVGGLGGPGRGRVSGHPKDVHLAGADLHDEEDVDPAQRDGVDGEEVGGQQGTVALSVRVTRSDPLARPEAT
jgi:hypothetical protein